MQKTTTYSVPFGMYYMPIMLANTVCIFLNITPACVLFFGKTHYLSDYKPKYIKTELTSGSSVL